MLSIVPASRLESTKRPLLSSLMRKVKLALQNFNEAEEGMNTVEAIILLFVAAIVLLVFFLLIWPLIRDKVMEALNNLFGQTGQ